MGPALRALGMDTTEEELQKLIDRIDTDKSGSIDFTEFKHYYSELFIKKLSEGLDFQKLQEIFEEYDADGSGFLDCDEFSFVMYPAMSQFFVLFFCIFFDICNVILNLKLRQFENFAHI